MTEKEPVKKKVTPKKKETVETSGAQAGSDNAHIILDELKKDSKTMTIPVIMLTTRSSDQDIEQGISRLAEEYVPKPFDLNELNRSVENTLKVR